MQRGFRIGRVFGINIRIDWSWLLIFLLITWNLSTAFGDYHPDWGTTLRWSTAVIAAILFFVSVLAHELAHSLFAVSRGVPVRNITLFLFGGVSNTQREPDSPGTEFWMALLGPLTSLVIGGLLVWLTTLGIRALDYSVASISENIEQLSPPLTLLLWLGSVNITLGIFNLIPGFPLDGGRVLRSILWAITDDLRRATRWASWVGQGLAWLLTLSGIAMIFGARIPFLGAGLSNGLWLAFIGWFLNNAASQSYQRVVIQDVLEGVPVRRMMRTNPPTVRPDCTVDSLVQDHIMGTDDQSFPVLEGEQIVGLVTLQDVREVTRDEWPTLRVRDIMTPVEKLTMVQADQDAAEAMEKLMQRDVRQLPVLQDERLAGLLRRKDIVKWLQLHSDFGLT